MDKNSQGSERDDREGRRRTLLVPEVLTRFDLDSLTGLTVLQARMLVESVGGELQALSDGQGSTWDFVGRRVTVVTSDERVVRVLGSG